MAIRATDTKPLAPPIAYAYLVVIVVSWAGNWPLMKLALAAAPPLQFVVLRLAGTIALLAAHLAALWRVAVNFDQHRIINIAT